MAYSNNFEIPPEQESPFEVARDLLDDRSPLEKVTAAINDQRVFVAYQPIINAYDFRKILALEALVRITDEFGRVIPAVEFIGPIENHEMGRVLDTEVMRICLAKLNSNRSVRLSLNVSARSIGHLPWRTTLEDAIRRDASIGGRLMLEFTEDSVNKVPELTTMFMKQMRSTGITFALDNFGAGKTTFHTFKNFMFDVIKFDNSMTKDLMKDSDSEVLIAALIEFCHFFDMGVVIDRIEDEKIIEMLRKLKVDYLQGHFFGKPRME